MGSWVKSGLMAAYSWVCGVCEGTQVSVSPIQVGPVAPECHGPMYRDYRADRPQFATATLKSTNRVGYSPDLFLPTQKDFEKPEDPDGSKGLKNWNETHIPKGHSGRTRPKIKTVF